MTNFTDLTGKAKRFLKLAGKAVGGLILLLFLYGIVLANFRVQGGGRYQCDGTLTSDDISRKAQMFLRLELYRRWLMPWEVYDGSVSMEIPGLWNGAMSLDNARSLDLWFLDDRVHDRKNVGRISRLSDTISVSTPHGVFEGAMRRIE